MPHAGIKQRKLNEAEIVDLMRTIHIPMPDDPSPMEDLFNYSIPEWKLGTGRNSGELLAVPAINQNS
jgi:hypothetical protein